MGNVSRYFQTQSAQTEIRTGDLRGWRQALYDNVIVNINLNIRKRECN